MNDNESQEENAAEAQPEATPKQDAVHNGDSSPVALPNPGSAETANAEREQYPRERWLQKCERWRKIALRRMTVEWLKPRFEIAALVAGLILLVVNCRQLRITGGQLEEMKTQTTISRDSFRTQLIVARQQLEEMHAQRTMDERAWVWPVLEVPHFKSDFLQQTNLYCTVTLKNTGRTPANGILAWAEWHQFSQPNKKDFYMLTNFPAKSGSIASGETIDCETRGGLNAFQIKEVGGGLPFFVFGMIEYEDVFSTFHLTPYCYEIGPDLKTFKGVRDLDAPNEDDTNLKPKNP